MSTAAPLQTQAAKSQPLSSSTHAGLLLQRKCACGSPTSSLTGECAECKSKKRLQTKLAIGASNDPLEQEADRVADRVLAAPADSAVSASPPHIHRFTGQPSAPTGTAPASVDRVLASPGSPLGPAMRQDMEQRFGHDFSMVRVHSDAASEQSARDVNAHAYTAGHDIVFGAGRFAPGTNVGRRLIVHELTHVVQQSGADGNSIRQNDEHCGGFAIPQPLGEGRIAARSVQRQPAPPAEMEFPAQWVFAADVRKRNDKRYARSLGHRDAARIRKSGTLSSGDQEEVNAKLGFFEGQAHAAYLQEIYPTLVEVTREEMEFPAEYTGPAERLILAEDVAGIIAEHLQIWYTASRFGIEKASLEGLSDDGTKWFLIALGGNLLWAATSFANPLATLAIRVMSVTGATIGSGTAEKLYKQGYDESAYRDMAVKMLGGTYTAIVNERPTLTDALKDLMVEEGLEDRGDSAQAEKRRELAWDFIFGSGIAYNDPSALEANAKKEVEAVWEEFSSCYAGLYTAVTPHFISADRPRAILECYYTALVQSGVADRAQGVAKRYVPKFQGWEYEFPGGAKVEKRRRRNWWYGSVVPTEVPQ